VSSSFESEAATVCLSWRAEVEIDSFPIPGVNVPLLGSSTYGSVSASEVRLRQSHVNHVCIQPDDVADRCDMAHLCQPPRCFSTMADTTEYKGKVRQDDVFRLQRSMRGCGSMKYSVKSRGLSLALNSRLLKYIEVVAYR
jgi:hypothetical protein